MRSKFGIIGAGGIGQALAHQLTNAGYHVILSNSRGPESLAASGERAWLPRQGRHARGSSTS